MSLEMIYDEMFHTGIIPDGATNQSLMASALGAWACCSFTKPPKEFGTAMAAIGKRLGFLATAETLSKKFDEWDAAGRPEGFFDN